MSLGSSSGHAQNTLVLRLAAFLCGLSLLLGVVFCVVASPKSLSQKYTARAVLALESRDYDSARLSMMSALRHDPVSADGWTIFARILEEGGHAQDARVAKGIAGHLMGASAKSNPLYATPADLRLSFLAIAGGDSY